MGKKKLWLTLLLVGLLAVLPLSRGLAAEIMASNFTEMANDYYKNWHAGAAQAVAALGCEYKFATDEMQPSRMISNLENFLSAGAKIFFVTCPDSSPVRTVAEMLQKEKAYFTNTWQTQHWMHPADIGDYYVAYFVPDDAQNAYELAKKLFEKMGGKGNLIHLMGAAGSTPDFRRTWGVNKALKEFPEIKVVARQHTSWERNKARAVMESLIVAHPDFQGVFGQNDAVGIGGMEACEATGIKVPITGIDGAVETMKLIKEGRYFATQAIHPSWQAGWAAVKAWDAAHGWKPTIPERMMFSAGMIVTAENVEAYMNKIYNAEKLPYDWLLMSRVKHREDWDAQNLVWPIDLEYFTMSSLGIDEVPADVKLNQAYLDAKASGEMEKIAQLYKEHYKKDVLK